VQKAKRSGLPETVGMRHDGHFVDLISDLQRKDLDIFEEADGLQSLIDLYSYNHQQVSDKIGKARSTITEILSIARIPGHVRDLIKGAGGFSRTTIIEIAKQKTEDDMLQLVREISQRRLTREDTRDFSKYLKGKTKKLKYFVFNFVPDDTDKFRMRLEFKKQTVSRAEIIDILEEIISRLKSKSAS
jgi:ParB family chromosome partitioning protein